MRFTSLSHESLHESVNLLVMILASNLLIKSVFESVNFTYLCFYLFQTLFDSVNPFGNDQFHLLRICNCLVMNKTLLSQLVNLLNQ